MLARRLPVLILIAHFLLGLSYAVATPVFEAGDELWHYPMVRHLADGNPLPVQVFDPALAGPWKQQASQPPLYYALGAALTFWIDTGDMAQVRRENPHVDNGIVTVDGNRNLVVHDPALNPWQGTLLAVRVVRLLSVALGTLTVWLTYRIGRTAAPDRPAVALGAMAVNAFLPMFLFIGGAVNNDNLIMPLSALTLLWLIEAVQRPRPPTRRRLVALGAVIGLAALAKIGGVLLLPLAAGALFLAAWRNSDRTATPAGLLRTLGRAAAWWLPVALTALAVGGWWYVRNVRLYGDWRGWNAFIAVLGQRAHPASPAQLWDERVGFMQAFWGLFGGVNVPLWPWAYTVLNGVLLLGVAGFVVYAVGRLRRSPLAQVRRAAALPGALLDTAMQHAAVVICLVWTAVVVAGLIDWATTTWSSQGRLVFSALSAEIVLLALGLGGWLPARAARALLGAVGAFMLVVAALAPWAIIRPAYQPVWQLPVSGTPVAVDAVFGEALALRGVTLDATTLAPGDGFDVYVDWELLAPLAQDWSVFVHLNDPVVGIPIAQRDMFHGQGLRPTSLLTPGQRFTSRYHLTVPATAVTPATLELAVGLYDVATGRRLATADGSDALLVARVPLRSAATGYPNPTAVNFGDRFRLVGYDVDRRRPAAGDGLALTLYVVPLGDSAESYTFFAQLVSPDVTDTTRWAAADVPQPTADWPPGVVQAVALPLTVDPATPPTVYDIIIGMYTVEDGAFRNLPLVSAEGRITNDNFLRLTKVRVDE